MFGRQRGKERPKATWGCGLGSAQVLFQGCQLDETKTESFLQQVYRQLCVFENKVAEMLQQQYEPRTQQNLYTGNGVDNLGRISVVGLNAQN
ncbi:UNVERIFIED_CONTAM: hypothetical protein K2H54_057155 [Gekko kuhli]